MTEELPDEVQRWTAKRRSALILSIVKGETTVQDEQIKRLEPTPRGRRSSAPSRERWSVSVHLKGALVLGVVVAVFGAGCGGGGKLGVRALS